MASTISNFLVGLGFQYDEKGVKQFNAGLEGIKAKALQTGGVIGGAFLASSLGLVKLTRNTARQMGAMEQFSKTFQIGANQVNALNQEMIRLGGTQQESMSNIMALNRVRNESNQQQAQLLGAAGRLQIKPQFIEPIIKARNNFEAYNEVIREGNKLTDDQQRRLIGLLGLSQKTFLQMQEGPKKFNEEVSKFQGIQPQFDQLGAESTKFNQALQETGQRLSSIKNALVGGLLTPLTAGLTDLNTFMGSHQKAINSGLAEITKHAVALGVAMSALAGGGAFLALRKIAHLFSRGGRAVATRAATAEAVTGGGAAEAGLGLLASPLAVGAGLLAPFAPELNKQFTGIRHGGSLTGRTAVGEAIGSQLGFLGGGLVLGSGNLSANLRRGSQFNFSGISPNVSSSSLLGSQFDIAAPTKHAEQNINVSLNLDGAEIDKRVIKVNQQERAHTLNNIATPVRG